MRRPNAKSYPGHKRLKARPTRVIVETERLILRLHRPEDMAARSAMTGDPQVVRHAGGVTQDDEDNWARILRYNGHWALFDCGICAVEEKSSGAFVGEAGFADFHRGIGADFDPFPEGAWMFARGAHGKGYATEAMQAVIAWAEDRFGPQRTVCLIASGNAPSFRVAEKLGFRRFAVRDYHGADRILLERLPQGDGRSTKGVLHEGLMV